MSEIVDFLRQNETVLIFLVIALGYLLGRIKVGWFSLGTTAGALIVGLIIGLIKFEVSPLVKSIGFGVFIYAVGLRVGPQFFDGMRKDGLKLITLALVACLAGFGITWVLAAWLDLAPGIAPGIIAGAMTNTPTLGAAEQAIASGVVALPAGVTAKAAMNNITVAYAITYLFGTVGLIIFLKILPRLFGYDLAQEAKKLDAEMSRGVPHFDPDSDYFSEYRLWDVRAFELTNDRWAGEPLSRLREELPGGLVIERIKRGDQIITPADDTVLQKGDLVAVSGHINDVARGPEVIGPEHPDKEVLDLVGEGIEILVTNKQALQKSLTDLGREAGYGCYVKGVIRSGVEQEVHQGLTLRKGDLLVVAGVRAHVDRLAKYLGYAVHRSAITDLFTLSVGMVVGYLLGAITVRLFDVPVTLGSAGGLLISGIVISFLRSRHPTFGNIPGGARAILEDIGLTVFIALVGLSAGGSVVRVLETSGPQVFLVGVAVTLVPAFLAFLWGKYVLKLNPVILIGACTGAITCTASLKAVNEEAQSSLPALGYPVPYAISTVVLTVMGYLIMLL
jgi:putative transport protein